MPRGRPSGYKPEFAAQAEKLCKLGATDNEIGQFFEVSVVTVWRWKNSFPDFCSALKRGKEIADELVEQSLFRRATGYSHDAVKIMQDKGAPVVVPYVEHHPPDTTAAIFWLKNRKPEQWRDKVQQELTGANGAPLVPILNVRLSGSGSEPAPQAGGCLSNDGD